jgi:hypothetical protein
MDILQPHIYVITKGEQLHELRMTSFISQVKNLVDTPSESTGIYIEIYYINI